MKKFKFYKETSGQWFIDLPEWEGAKADLQMVAGADVMLDKMSNGNNEVYVYISEEYFVGSDVLEFIRDATELGDGAYYILKNYQGAEINLEMWLCGVTKFVFGHFPDKIFIAPVSENLSKLHPEELKILIELTTEPKRIIFGLTPLAALVNSIILAILSGIFWSIAFIKQIPAGTSFKFSQLNINVPWYYDMPFIILSFVLLFSFIEYRFNIKPTEFSWRSVKYKYLYGAMGIFLISIIIKTIMLASFLR